MTATPFTLILNVYEPASSSENVYCTFTFDVVGSGDTTVNLNVDYLTGTEAVLLL